MLLIRRFEEKAAEAYALGKIGGFLHLYIGEEAVAVGATSVLRPDDYAISAYREHGHCLAKGSDPKRMMAELFGRRDGLSKGKGGSMHLFDRTTNFLGGHAIVGAHLPIAVGVGFAIKYRGGDQVIVLLLRRRRGAGGRVPRSDESRGAVEAAGHLPVREQPLRDGHLGRARARPDGDLEVRTDLRHSGRARGRHGRPRGARRGQPRRRPDTAAEGSGADRGRYLSLPRPLDARSGRRRLSHEGRSGAREASRSDRAVPRQDPDRGSSLRGRHPRGREGRQRPDRRGGGLTPTPRRSRPASGSSPISTRRRDDGGDDLSRSVEHGAARGDAPRSERLRDRRGSRPRTRAPTRSRRGS